MNGVYDHYDHSDLVVLHKTYVRLGEERDDDVVVLCRDYLAAKGLLCNDDGFPVWWDAERYPWDAEAAPAHPCYRPGPDWPPSLDEIEHRPPK